MFYPHPPPVCLRRRSETPGGALHRHQPLRPVTEAPAVCCSGAAAVRYSRRHFWPCHLAPTCCRCTGVLLAGPAQDLRSSRAVSLDPDYIFSPLGFETCSSGTARAAAAAAAVLCPIPLRASHACQSPFAFQPQSSTSTVSLDKTSQRSVNTHHQHIQLQHSRPPPLALIHT